MVWAHKIGSLSAQSLRHARHNIRTLRTQPRDTFQQHGNEDMTSRPPGYGLATPREVFHIYIYIYYYYYSNRLLISAISCQACRIFKPVYRGSGERKKGPFCRVRS